jgi:hypothetical protein
MGTDEEGTFDRLKAHRRELVDPKIEEHQPALLGAARKDAQRGTASRRFPRRTSAMRTVAQPRGHSATQATPRRLAALKCSA